MLLDVLLPLMKIIVESLIKCCLLKHQDELYNVFFKKRPVVQILPNTIKLLMLVTLN